jgi:hypothetical protein
MKGLLSLSPTNLEIGTKFNYPMEKRVGFSGNILRSLVKTFFLISPRKAILPRQIQHFEPSSGHEKGRLTSVPFS